MSNEEKPQLGKFVKVSWLSQLYCWKENIWTVEVIFGIAKTGDVVMIEGW